MLVHWVAGVTPRCNGLLKGHFGELQQIIIVYVIWK